jgi:hypothetical protein
MGVADVHVAVVETGRGEQVAGVDRAVGPRSRELGGLADPADAPVLDEDRAILDDPPLSVEGDDVAGIVDLQALGWHGSPPVRGMRFRLDPRTARSDAP